MAYFPFFVDIEGQHCLLVGGGMVAYRKAEVLVPFGPEIQIVAPEVIEPLRNLVRDENQGRLQIHVRKFEDQDIEHADFVIAATEDSSLNRRISALCKGKKIPVNVVDVQEECSFIFPALIKDGDITVGISTGGSSPTIAQYLKSSFRESIPEGFGALAIQLGSYRELVKSRVDDIHIRTAIFREMVKQGIAGGCHLSREEAEDLIRRKQKECQ